MIFDDFRVLSKTTFTRLPTDPVVTEMLLRMVQRFAHQGNLDQANRTLRAGPPTYTRIEEQCAENLFDEATFCMLTAAENFTYIHYAVGDTRPRLHIVKADERNCVGAVFSDGDTQTIRLIIFDGIFYAEDTTPRSEEEPLWELLDALGSVPDF